MPQPTPLIAVSVLRVLPDQDARLSARQPALPAVGAKSIASRSVSDQSNLLLCGAAWRSQNIVEVWSTEPAAGAPADASSFIASLTSRLVSSPVQPLGAQVMLPSPLSVAGSNAPPDIGRRRHVLAHHGSQPAVDSIGCCTQECAQASKKSAGIRKHVIKVLIDATCAAVPGGVGARSIASRSCVVKRDGVLYSLRPPVGS